MHSLNLGQKYESKIKELLNDLGILPIDTKGNDAGFYHLGNAYYLEVKNKKAPDYGQKKLNWNKSDGWQWSIPDNITAMYDLFRLRELINPTFVPRRYSKPKEIITLEDRVFDQEFFELSGFPADINLLYEYYAKKDCYYMQIENKGFYYLKTDVAELRVPQFITTLTFRLRAKAHHYLPFSDYSFFAVLNVRLRDCVSSGYDLEQKVGIFPPIE